MLWWNIKNLSEDITQLQRGVIGCMIAWKTSSRIHNMSYKQGCPLLRGLKELIALQTGKVYVYKARLLDDSGFLKALCLRHLNTMGFYLPFTQCSFISLSLLFLSLNMNDRRLKVLWGGKYFLLAWLWKPDLINKMPCWELFLFSCHRK